MNRRLLLVDDDAAVREAMTLQLSRLGFEVTAVAAAEAGLSVLSDVDPAALITDVRMPGMSGIELTRLVHERAPDIQVIVITAFEDMGTTIGAIRAGAYDYLVKPLDLDHLELVLERALRERTLRQRVRRESEDLAASAALGELAGRTPAMIEIYKRIGLCAATRTPVLIRGETGTGKELIARAIHAHGTAADEPFVAVNCTAIPESLLESELFGHVRGAFTGAIADRRGCFEQAGRGTIFLDEIGDVSPAFQTKLLRVLQEREYHPVGSERTRRTDARVIAATHVDLEARTRDGRFREDLYYRLRVVELVVPSLRERRDDIPVLVEHLLRRIAAELHRAPLVVPPASMRLLQESAWPGNVRELENALSRAAVLSPSGVLSPESFDLTGETTAPSQSGGDSLADVTRHHLATILARTRWNKRAAARILGISRARLDRLVERHALVAPERGTRGLEP